MRRICWQPVAWIVQWVDETGSTNADLLAAARAGAAAGTVLAADHQTAGRGRLGRRWQAPPGSSLLVSILFHAPRPNGLHRFTQAVGLAAVDACRDVAGVEAALKWPNDVLVGSRKLAGILAETAPLSRPGVDEGIAVVVGIGLNVTWPVEIPEDLVETMTALNLECGRPVDRDAVLEGMLTALEVTDWVALHDRYRTTLATLGRQVRVEQATGVVEGVAVDVRPDGRLVVQTSQGEREITTGDVVHLR
jgi:BirA family transcriptional regulator, biotin operon repressor / biotin---[acetyl-CoA-carboxylase] ligase